MLILVIIGFLAGAGIIAYGYVGLKHEEETLESRLNRYEIKPAGSLTALELQLPRRERLLRPLQMRIAEFVRVFTPSGTVEKSQAKLAQAGHPNNMSVQDLLGIKGILALVLALCAFLLFVLLFQASFGTLIMAVLGGAVLGFILPNFWLGRRIKERQSEITKYLPDAIDILAISVAAGQGFDGALETLSRRKQNALTLEFDRFRMETQAGKGRADALRDLALRTGVQDMRTFVAAMIQADQLGIGIAQVLKTQSEELRLKRKQRAEEKAHQAPIKMLFPLVLLMFPALFIVILAPALPNLAMLGHA